MKLTNRPVVLWVLHPLTEPCTGQILALRKPSLAGHADGVLLVIPAGDNRGRNNRSSCEGSISSKSFDLSLGSRFDQTEPAGPNNCRGGVFVLLEYTGIGHGPGLSVLCPTDRTKSVIDKPKGGSGHTLL